MKSQLFFFFLFSFFTSPYRGFVKEVAVPGRLCDVPGGDGPVCRPCPASASSRISCRCSCTAPPSPPRIPRSGLITRFYLRECEKVRKTVSASLKGTVKIFFFLRGQKSKSHDTVSLSKDDHGQ